MFPGFLFIFICMNYLYLSAHFHSLCVFSSEVSLLMSAYWRVLLFLYNQPLLSFNTLCFFLYLFIYGYTGSFFAVHGLFLAGNWGLLSSCNAWASLCGGFSCCREWVLGHVVFSSCGTLFSCPAACGIFLNQGSNLYY